MNSGPNRMRQLLWWAALMGLMSFSMSTWSVELAARLLGLPPPDYLRDGSPVYFIRRDFVEGVCATFAIVLGAVIAAVFWKSYRRDGGFTFALVISIFLVPKIAKGALIYSRCSNLLDAEHAKYGWASSAEYLSDPMRWIPFWAMMAVLVLLSIARYRKQSADDPPKRA